MQEKLIEKAGVYPGNRLEIVWKFEGHPLELSVGHIRGSKDRGGHKRQAADQKPAGISCGI